MYVCSYSALPQEDGEGADDIHAPPSTAAMSGEPRETAYDSSDDDFGGVEEVVSCVHLLHQSGMLLSIAVIPVSTGIEFDLIVFRMLMMMKMRKVSTRLPVSLSTSCLYTPCCRLTGRLL